MSLNAKLISIDVEYECGQKMDISFTETSRVWEFPKEKYFEYEPKDEEWCRRLGIGEEVEQRYTYRFPNARVIFSGEKLVVFAEPTPRDDWWTK